MFELIVLGIFLISLCGAGIILYRKLPTLTTLPQNGHHGLRKPSAIVQVEHKIRDLFVELEKKLFLHKLLSWAKVVILKVEVQIDQRLHGLRKNAQKVEK